MISTVGGALSVRPLIVQFAPCRSNVLTIFSKESFNDKALTTVFSHFMASYNLYDINILLTAPKGKVKSESKAKKQSLTWGNKKVKRSVHHEQAPERVLHTIIYKKEKGKALRLTLATEC